MIWNETIECMDREEMRKLQSLRLKRVVEHAYHNSPFYRKKMQEMGITPDDVQTIDDITKLPFTVKQDLRDNYPFGLMAVPMSEIVRLHASSGTTGLAAIKRHAISALLHRLPLLHIRAFVLTVVVLTENLFLSRQTEQVTVVERSHYICEFSREEIQNLTIQLLAQVTLFVTSFIGTGAVHRVLTRQVSMWKIP